MQGSHSVSRSVGQSVGWLVGRSVAQSDRLSCHDSKLALPAVPQHVLNAHGEVSRMAPDEPSVWLKLKFKLSFKLRYIYTLNPGAVQTPFDPLPPSSKTSTNPTLFCKPCLPLNSTLLLLSRRRFNSCRHSCRLSLSLLVRSAWVNLRPTRPCQVQLSLSRLPQPFPP